MKKLSLFLLVLMLIIPVSAQDETTTEDTSTMHPVEAILRHIPSVESARQNFLSYIDVQATHDILEWIDAEEAYTHQSFLEAFPTGFQFTSRWGYIPNELATIPFGMNPAIQTPSLDLFQIGQIASYGAMDNAGTILRGEFDVDSLLDTYRNLDAYWIEEAGISHLVRNRDEIQPNQHNQNFFDAMMKRAVPLVVQSGDPVSFVGSALSENLFNDVITTFEHSDSSIWHNTYYQLTAQALIDWETNHQAQLIQALWIPQTELIKRSVNFRNPADIQALPHFLQSPNPDEAIPAWTAGYREITSFELPILIADLQIDEEQVFLLIVPFDHIGNAEFSAGSLAERLQTYNNQTRAITDQPFVQLYDGTISHATYQDASGEHGAAVIAMRYNAPTVEVEGNPVYQANVYNTIYTSITESLFYLLWDVTLP